MELNISPMRPPYPKPEPATPRASMSEEPNSLPCHGLQAQKLFECNRKLKELGINSTIKLPQICVIGDQSTGKSSLIEAISGIEVPRADNCCTQCPISINVAPGEHENSQWTCKISIEQTHFYEGDIGKKRPNKNRPLGPWTPLKDSVTTEFARTNNKAEVANLINAATQAILNPHKDPLSFLPQNYQSDSQTQLIQFSPNVIVLDISQGRWPHLSFIDLPGVISNTHSTEDSFLVKLVENLVKSYASLENCVNLLTLPMTTDLANSNARRIIQQLRAEPQTMAVLTKPDHKLDESMPRAISDYFRKDSESFGYGYRVVMMKPQKNGVHSRNMEREFFAHPRWLSDDLTFSNRLGVENLKACMADVLFTKLQETLPGSFVSIQNQMSEINHQLKLKPAPPLVAEVPTMVLDMTREFKNTMNAMMNGAEDERKNFLVKWRELVQKFRMTILEAKPMIIVNPRAERARLTQANKQLAETKFRNSGTEETPFDIDDDDDSPTPIQARVKTQDSDRVASPPMSSRFDLDELRKINNSYNHSGLPDQLYPEAKRAIILKSLDFWDKPMAELMNATTKLVWELTTKVTADIFQPCKHLPLFQEVNDYVELYLRNLESKEYESLLALKTLESAEPFTLDEPALVVKRSQQQQLLQKARTSSRIKLAQAEQDALAPSAGRQRRKEVTEADLGPDDYAIEMALAGEVRGYYDLASNRYVDNVGHRILVRFFNRCFRDLPTDLEEYLGPRNQQKHEKLAKWMSETEEEQAQRAELVSKSHRLAEGKEYIEKTLGYTVLNERKRRSGSPDPDTVDSPSKRLRGPFGRMGVGSDDEIMGDN